MRSTLSYQPNYAYLFFVGANNEGSVYFVLELHLFSLIVILTFLFDFGMH